LIFYFEERTHQKFKSQENISLWLL